MLIAGARRGNPIGVHKILRVGFVEEKSIDGVYLASSETDNVNVQFLCLESSQQLNEGVFKEMYAFDALLFVIEDGEFEEQSVGRMREIIKKVVGEFYEDEDEHVALVIKSRGSKAAKIATISREFRGLLKNFGYRKVFCTPATRLGLLDVLDFDQLTIKSRKKLRMVWKERRREARWRFDERQEVKKEKKAELKRKRKRKEKKAKSEKKFERMLHKEAREGYSTEEEEEGGTSSRSDSEEEEEEEESESSLNRMSNSD